MLEQPVVYSYLMGVQAIDQNIFPEVLVFPNTERILFKTKTALKRNTKAQRCPYTSKMVVVWSILNGIIKTRTL